VVKLRACLLRGVVPLLCAALLLLFPAAAAAKGGAALTVYGAAGKAGENVVITVNLHGIKALAGIEGLSGAEFELQYDPAAASIKKISKGSIAGRGFMFMDNKNFSESSAKVVLAAVSGLITDDGDLCKFTFTLEKDGPVEVMLKEVVIFDQDLRALTVGAVSELPPESASGEGSLPGSGSSQDDGGPAGPGGTAVELFSPTETVPPAGEDPDLLDGKAPGKAAAPEGSSGDAVEGPLGAPAGENRKGLSENVRRWLLLAAALLGLFVAGASFYLYRKRLLKNNNTD
jgi:hypothetical protein